MAHVREELESEGFTLYSMKSNEDVPTLVMYKSSKKRFAFFAFHEGRYFRADAWLTMAESKAETFGTKIVPPYSILKETGGGWKIEEGEV